MTTRSRKGKEKVVPDIEMAAGQDQAAESYKEFSDRMLAARMTAHNFTRDYMTESADDFEVELAPPSYILPRPIPRVSGNSRRLSEIANTVPPDIRRLLVTSIVPGEGNLQQQQQQRQQQPELLEPQPMQSSNELHVPCDSQEIVPGGQQWEDVANPSSQLQYANARALLTKEEFGRLFQSLDPGSMDEIWELTTDLKVNKIPLTVSPLEKIKALTSWSPGTMFLDKQKRTYRVYHPCVMETRKNTWFLVGFDKENTSKLIDQDWVSLPTIDYLPVEQNEAHGKTQRRIIAGSAGLLVVDTGNQGPAFKVKPKGGTPMVVNEKFWKHGIYPHPQSIVYVTNPLTQEYRILPPVTGRLLKGKAARLVWRNMERTSYMLILVGYDDKVPRSQKRKRELEDQVGIFVYCSELESYSHADCIYGRPNVRIREGDSGLGVIGYGVYFGGYSSRKLGNQPQCPCVYYFNVSKNDKCHEQTPFTVPELPAGISLLAPRVLQVGPERLFAVTRQSESLGAVFLTDILLTEKGRCHGFQLIATTPDDVTNEIFRKTECDSLCDVSACCGIIAIRGGGKSNIVALYNVELNKWSITRFPRQRDVKVAYFKMMEAAYEPNFLARP